ncbi:MAG TPA: ABC transporter permease [Streptosporangiaceae bacterium]|nr:ABC transporter permease [Streptosporangiaceae bacterium]
MIRFAWTRFRTQAAVGAGMLAVAAIALLVTGIQLAHAYDTAAAACKQHGDCAGLFNAFLTQGYFTAGKLLGAVGLAVPGLIGMFWGAPLVAREFETGTFRLAWTQGVTRTRWLAAKLAVAGAAAVTVGEAFTLMVNWWSSPIDKANAGYTAFTSGSFHSGIAPAGYAAFGFALGVAAGLFIRRTLPAMAVTLAIFTAVIIAFPIWVRPHLIPPVRATSALSLASVAVTGSSDGHLILTTRTATGRPGAWVISSQVATPDGRVASGEPAGPCGASSARACNDYIASLRFHQTVAYEPASRYWAFQWIETGIYLALALLLAGLCFLRIRPGRLAALDIHRPRGIRSAPALESSR